MTVSLFSTIEDSLFSFTGDMWIIAVCILIFLIIAFMIVGVDFKYAIIFTSPLVLGFVQIGWFPIWIQTVFWLLIVGLGVFLFMTYMSDR